MDPRRVVSPRAHTHRCVGGATLITRVPTVQWIGLALLPEFHLALSHSPHSSAACLPSHSSVMSVDAGIAVISSARFSSSTNVQRRTESLSSDASFAICCQLRVEYVSLNIGVLFAMSTRQQRTLVCKMRSFVTSNELKVVTGRDS